MFHFIRKSIVVLLLIIAIAFGTSISSADAQSYADNATPAKLRQIGCCILLSSAYSFSSDGAFLIIGDSLGGIEVRDATNGDLVRRFPHNHFFNLLGPHSAEVTALSVSSDGKTLISGSGDKTVKVWNLQTGQLLHDLTDFQNPIVSLAFRQNSKEFLTGESSQTFKIWSADTGSLIQVISNPDSESALNLSSNGEWLWSVESDVKFWSIDDTTQVHHSITTSSGHTYFSDRSWRENSSGLNSFDSVAFSPTTNQMIVLGKCAHQRRSCVNVFDVERNVWYDDEQPSRILHAAALSPDQHLIATSGYYAWTDLNPTLGNRITIEDFKLRRTIVQHDLPDKSALIRTLIFSPDSKELLTVDEEGNFTLWAIPN